MRVGLIGCGLVGRQLGKSLLEAGHELLVYDIVHEAAEPLLQAGATWAPTLDECVALQDWVVTALPGPHEVETVCRRALALMKPGTLLLETSTIDAPLVRQLHSEAHACGVILIDAGVSLGHQTDHGARLALWFGGDARSYRSFRPQLATLGEPTLYCGPPGSGKIVKLVSNAVAHSLVVLLSETLTTGVKAGVPLEILCGALGSGTAQTGMLDEILPHSLFRGDFRPGLRMELAIKDLRLACELATVNGTSLPVVERALQAYKDAESEGLGGESLHAVAKLFERQVGCDLRLGRYRTNEEAS